MRNRSAPNSSAPVTSPVTVYVCTQCGIGCVPASGKQQANPQARALVAGVRKALGNTSNIIVKLSRCLGACDAPIAYAFTGNNRETLVFTHGADTVSAEVIAAAATTYASKRAGTRYQKADIPQPQRGTVFARIPAPAKPKS